jgi:hypothetical protein
MIAANRILFVGMVLVVWGTAGCGVFKSSTSQASSESSSKSSSSCSGGDEKKDAYRRDVRDVTARHAATVADASTLERDVGAVAERHGVSDWERDQQTYVGMGQGLARANVTGSELERDVIALSHANARHAAWIRAGYGGTATP